jgi:hypothetical protein
MDILELLKSQVDGNMLKQLSEQIGSDESQTGAAVNGVFSALLNGVGQNIQQPEKASGLLEALDRDHDGSILNDLAGLMGGKAQVQNQATVNGSGILGHILGGNTSKVAEMIGRMSGIDASQSGVLLEKLAPVLLGVLGKVKTENSGGGQGLLDLITKTTQTHNTQTQAGGIFQKLLDKDGDGQIMDDIIGMGAKSLLGGLFK